MNKHTLIFLIVFSGVECYSIYNNNKICVVNNGRNTPG